MYYKETEKFALAGGFADDCGIELISCNQDVKL